MIVPILLANSIGLTDSEKYEILIQENEKEMNKTLNDHLRLRTILANQYTSITDYYSLN